jgi:hypothetical protein
MAWWVDERELERVKYIVESNGVKMQIRSVFGMGGSNAEVAGRGRRGRSRSR